jgi:hypothetical protein
MKRLLLATAMVCTALTAHARPQLSTPAIGWLDPSDIRCYATSDHMCEVTEGCGDCSVFAFVWADQHSVRQKYRIAAKTPLVIVSEGKDNKSTDDDGQGFTYEKRVQVAIVMDSDWDGNGHVVPSSPGCHLTTEGKFPPIVSVACRSHPR